MGAWIETSSQRDVRNRYNRSHPTWVRGLKQDPSLIRFDLFQSHPTWVRGLKHNKPSLFDLCLMSHPTWVRGLKQLGHVADGKRTHVAPYVGAWIETSSTLPNLSNKASHPTWVRGLKRVTV